MEVGILFRGDSLVQPVEGIELKRCLTFKQLAKYNIRLLENVKQEDLEQVKQLPKEGSTYSIGACDVAIKNVTLYIKDLDDILNEKDAVLKEKEKSIKILKETTEQNVALSKEVENRDISISELKSQIKDLQIENDRLNSTVNELEKSKSALNDKLVAETELRIKTQTDLQNYKDNLGTALEETDRKVSEKENELNTKYTDEIDRIHKIISEKDSIIAEKDDKIAELLKVNEELGKAGSIPDIPFTYEGKATIIGVCSRGSNGVSSFVHCISRLITEQKKVLVVDLDFKRGNLGNYFNSDNKTIENNIRGGPILVEHLISSKGRLLDYIGGVIDDYSPYDIINIDWASVFTKDGDYDYIIVDTGIYGGYNIQTKICEFIARLGKMVYIYKDGMKEEPNFINVKNFAKDYTGIPFISKIMSTNSNLYAEPITKAYIVDNILNKLI